MEKRFGSLPADLGEALERILDLEALDELIGQAAVVEDVETYLAAVREHATG